MAKIYITLAGFMALVGLLAAGQGIRRSAWWAWPLSLLLIPPATGITIPIGNLLFNCRLIALVLAIAAFAPREPERPAEGRRWILLDSLMLGLALTGILSRIFNGTFGDMTLIGTVIEFMPYIVGRLYLQSVDDFPQAAGPILIILGVTTGLLWLESVSAMNLPLKLARARMIQEYRFGFNRARGAIDSPIPMGFVMLLLSGWAVGAASWARATRQRRWWRFTPLVSYLGALATWSRGPMLGIPMAAFWRFSLRRRASWFWLMLGLGGMIGIFQYQEELARLAGGLLGEKFDAQNFDEDIRIVKFGDREVQYTGTMHRMLLWDAYADVLATAGLFGYGWNESVLGQVQNANYFWSIDNQYVLVLVNRGYVGLVLFLGLTGTALWTLGRLARDRDHPLSEMAVGTFAGVLTVALGIYTVWMGPAVLGDAYYFMLGVAGTLGQLRLERGEHLEGDRDDEALDPHEEPAHGIGEEVAW
jgi:hypothetical protein